MYLCVCVCLNIVNTRYRNHSTLTNKYIQGDVTHLYLLQWLDVKCGKQQQATDPGQSGLLQFGH